MGVDRGILSALHDHKEKIKGPHFIMSSQNPKYPEKNELGFSHEKLLSHLKSAGYDAHGVNAHYDAPEKSILVYGVSPEQATKLHGLASRLGQDSSIYSSGKEHQMHFHHGTDKGKVVNGTGTEWHKQKPKNMYTSLPGEGGHFTHNFDFGNNGLKFAKSEESKLNLIHFSNKGGLTHIDPKHKGSGVDSRTKGRDTWHPHSFYYLEGTQPESLVTNQSAHKYKTSIDTNKTPVYDIGKDSRGIVKDAIRENQGALNMDHVHQKLKNEGFHGFFNSSHPQLHNVVAFYHPLKVENHEDTRK